MSAARRSTRGIAAATACLAALAAGRTVAAAMVKGVGYLVVDFENGAYTQAAAGTDVKFTYERYWIDMGDHQVLTRQTAEVWGTGGAHQSGIVAAGLLNRRFGRSVDLGPSWTDICPDQGRTEVHAFLWTDIGGFWGHIGAGVNPDTNEGRPSVRLELRRTEDPVALSRWKARFYDSQGLFPGVPVLTWAWHAGPYPALVTEAKHGLYSTDTTFTNQIHLGLDEPAYYALPSCVVERLPYCPAGTWQPLPLAGGIGEEEAPAGVMQVYDAPGHARHVCSGRCPDTPCGCLDCPGNVWLRPGESGPPERPTTWDIHGTWPPRYRVTCFGTPPDCDEWKDAVDEAARLWNDALRPSAESHSIVLGRFDDCGSGEPDIEVFVYGSKAIRRLPPSDTPYLGLTVIGGEQEATDGCGSAFWRQESTPVHINATRGPGAWHYDQMTTCDWMPTPPCDPNGPRDSMVWVAAHEFGHALHLAHLGSKPSGPEGWPPQPPTPTPQPSGTHAVWGVMANEMESPWGYHKTPIDTDIDSVSREAAKCLFYR